MLVVGCGCYGELLCIISLIALFLYIMVMHLILLVTLWFIRLISIELSYDDVVVYLFAGK